MEAFVRTCHPCQVAKQIPTVKAGIGRFPVPDQRFTGILLDVVGPLPPSEGHRFFLTVFCRTTRWLEAYPMKESTSEACLTAFINEYVPRFGIPLSAVLDNGPCFVSNMWKGLHETLGTVVSYTPPLHPQSLGSLRETTQGPQIWI